MVFNSNLVPSNVRTSIVWGRLFQVQYNGISIIVFIVLLPHALDNVVKLFIRAQDYCRMNNCQ